PLSEDELDDPRPSSRPSYMLSLRLSSDKLRSLGLVYGANECRFSITTKFQLQDGIFVISSHWAKPHHETISEEYCSGQQTAA
ncbi:hypothetical protein TELCIR_25532, partial [Teladorsagia circumcincta]